MDFAYDPETIELQERLRGFMETHVLPAEVNFYRDLDDLDDLDGHDTAGQRWAWSRTPTMRSLQAAARAEGLWNLFLPGEHGAGLSNLQYASLAEITGHNIHLAPPALNCAAPDTGNIEVLAQFASPEQQQRWLQPLLAGQIRSAFAMTEPDVASSDATNIETRIERRGDRLVINGRKWWITGAMNPDCEMFIVMGKTDPQADRHHQQSMVIVPRDTAGVEVVRSLDVFGFDDREHGGHGELLFRDVEVPVENLIGAQGGGFGIAQARLGPGRIHHCMRAIGIGERALQLMCERASSRVAFGSPLATRGMVHEWIAESRVRLEQLRLLILKTAWLMDTAGNRAAHTEIQAIKIATPRTVEWIVDKAIQVHGAAGLGQDYPLAAAYAGVRSLRLADGPDEVHITSMAKREVRRHTST